MQGIMFNDDYGLHQAVISGHKTTTFRSGCSTPSETRFLKSLQGNMDELRYETRNYGNVVVAQFENLIRIKPKYKIGEKVYLKEPTFRDPNTHQIFYKYGGDLIPDFPNWKNKMCMGEDRARHFIKIISVTLRDIQSLDEQECIDEGVMRYKGFYVNYANMTPELDTSKESFKSLILALSGQSGWDKYRLGWLYTFELCKDGK